MARTKTLDEPVRVNYIIEKRQNEALRQLSHTTGRNLSDLVRLAIDNMLEQDTDDIERPIKGEFADVIALIEFMKIQIAKNGKKKSWELKRAQLSMLFGSHWWKIKSVVEMTVLALEVKGISIMHEEIVLTQDVPGTTRTKSEKYGFKIVTSVPISRKDLCKVKHMIEKDVKSTGRIMSINARGTLDE